MINNLRHLIHSVYKLVNVNDTPTFQWNKHANAVMEVWTHEWQRQIKWNNSKFHRQRRHRAIKKNHINTRITIEFRWERNKVQTMESKNEMELYIIFNYSNDELEIYTMENIDDDMIWFSIFFIALLLSAKKKKTNCVWFRLNTVDAPFIVLTQTENRKVKNKRLIQIIVYSLGRVSISFWTWFLLHGNFSWKSLMRKQL